MFKRIHRWYFSCLWWGIITALIVLAFVWASMDSYLSASKTEFSQILPVWAFSIFLSFFVGALLSFCHSQEWAKAPNSLKGIVYGSLFSLVGIALMPFLKDAQFFIGIAFLPVLGLYFGAALNNGFSSIIIPELCIATGMTTLFYAILGGTIGAIVDRRLKK